MTALAGAVVAVSYSAGNTVLVVTSSGALHMWTLAGLRLEARFSSSVAHLGLVGSALDCWFVG
jgi:hypothetical protein